jgi:AGCS family alanine or glycine:cation symporter
MGLLALVNLIALAMLFKPAKRVMADYEAKRKQGHAVPTFSAEEFSDLNIDEAAWPKR